MTGLAGVENPRVHESNVVEIQWQKFETHDVPPAFNYVAVVVPASAKISSEHGTEVRYSNGTGVKVGIWHPRPWYQDTGDSSIHGTGNVDTSGQLIELADGEVVTLRVDESRAVSSGLNDDRARQFRVFVHGINEFAIGDSPPKMNLDP